MNKIPCKLVITTSCGATSFEGGFGSKAEAVRYGRDFAFGRRWYLYGMDGRLLQQGRCQG